MIVAGMVFVAFDRSGRKHLLSTPIDFRCQIVHMCDGDQTTEVVDIRYEAMYDISVKTILSTPSQHGGHVDDRLSMLSLTVT